MDTIRLTPPSGPIRPPHVNKPLPAITASMGQDIFHRLVPNRSRQPGAAMLGAFGVNIKRGTDTEYYLQLARRSAYIGVGLQIASACFGWPPGTQYVISAIIYFLYHTFSHLRYFNAQAA